MSWETELSYVVSNCSAQELIAHGVRVKRSLTYMDKLS